MSRPEQLRQEYESTARAAHYRDDRWTRSARARRTHAKELALVDGLVQRCRQIQQSPRLDWALDLPCGTGRFRSVLESHCTQLLSVDAAFEMLTAAPCTCQLQASAHALPLVNNAADLILCSRLLHHFETSDERQAVLGELARVSKRWVVLSYFDQACFQAWRNRLRGKFRGRFPIAAAQFAREIQAAGFEERARHYICRGFSEQVWVLLEFAA